MNPITLSQLSPPSSLLPDVSSWNLTCAVPESPQHTTLTLTLFSADKKATLTYYLPDMSEGERSGICGYLGCILTALSGANATMNLTKPLSAAESPAARSSRGKRGPTGGKATAAKSPSTGLFGPETEGSDEGQ